MANIALFAQAIDKLPKENIRKIICEKTDKQNNFYVNRSSNAAVESFNAKIKSFRTSLRGIVDKSSSYTDLLKYSPIPTNYLLIKMGSGGVNFGSRPHWGVSSILLFFLPKKSLYA